MFLPSNGIDAGINAACATFSSNLLLLFCTSVLGGLTTRSGKRCRGWNIIWQFGICQISQIVRRFGDPVAISMI